MKIDILTLFPEVFSSVLNTSVLKKATEKGILEFNYVNIRDYTLDKHKKVDDYPYGGGAGMLLKTQPLYYAYNDIYEKAKTKPKTIYMSPRGKVFNQEIAKELAKEEHIVLICGHYEGIDQRVIDEICDCELSIGDFVLTGGEIAAMTVADAVSRLVPGVLSSSESYTFESHYNGLLEYPQYTRPQTFLNRNVPEVLLSGNQKEIDGFREEKSKEITLKVRPDLFALSEILCSRKACNVKIPKGAFSLNVLCSDEVKKNKVQSSIIMHLEKRKINNISDNAENTVNVYCDNASESKNTVGNILSVAYLDDMNLSAVKIGDEGIIPAKPMLSASEIADEVYKFLLASENDCLEYTDSEIENIEFLSQIPYELYQNHIEKFKKYSSEDIFVIRHKNKDFGGAATFCFEDSRIYLFEGKVFNLKAKKYGNVSLLAGADLGRYYTNVIIKNNLYDKFRGVTGKFGQVCGYKARIKGKDIISVKSEKEIYENECPYVTEGLEFFDNF